MSNTSLPQVCARCQKLKLPSLGEFSWSRHKWHRRIWVCYECLGKPRVPRLLRKNDETPIEKEAREAIEGLQVKAFAEYPMGKFIFDFVLPRHRLIVEVDSETYHSSGWRRRNDEQKDDWARRNRWKLVRVRSPDIAQQIVHAVKSRRAELG